PGQKEDRYRHLLGAPAEGGARDDGVPAAAAAPGLQETGDAHVQSASAPVADGRLDGLAERVAALEAEVASLRRLGDELVGLRGQLGDLLD
ncbi:MAG: hypothetical protein ACRDMX_01860, partial [Solirubrobacteraceae bacterium]